MFGTTPRRVVAGIALVGATAVGGLTIAAIDPIGALGAQEATTTTAPAADGASARARVATAVDEVLDGLVADGTLTQEQADAVADALRARAQQARDDHGGNHERIRRFVRAGIDESAAALGMTPAELRAELRDDRTVADVAEERGVPLADVVDALMAAATERIDAAVADGSLTEAQATKLTDALPDRLERLLTTPRSARPGRDAAAAGD